MSRHRRKAHLKGLGLGWRRGGLWLGWRGVLRRQGASSGRQASRERERLLARGIFISYGGMHAPPKSGNNVGVGGSAGKSDKAPPIETE